MTSIDPALTGSRFTPLNESDDSCTRTCAQLIIYLGNIDPSAITDLLGLEPTRIVRKGERSAPNSIGRTRLGKLNIWFLSSEDHISSADLRHHLDWLLERLLPKDKELIGLQKEVGVSMYVSCPWWSRYGGGGPSLWPEQMRGMAQLNLECTFGFGVDDEAAEEREGIAAG